MSVETLSIYLFLILLLRSRSFRRRIVLHADTPLAQPVLVAKDSTVTSIATHAESLVVQTVLLNNTLSVMRIAIMMLHADTPLAQPVLVAEDSTVTRIATHAVTHADSLVVQPVLLNNTLSVMSTDKDNR